MSASHVGRNPVILCDGERLSVEVDNWRIDLADALEVGSRLFLCKSKTWRGLGEDDERILWPFGGKEAISSAHTKALHIAREQWWGGERTTPTELGPDNTPLLVVHQGGPLPSLLEHRNTPLTRHSNPLQSPDHKIFSFYCELAEGKHRYQQVARFLSETLVLCQCPCPHTPLTWLMQPLQLYEGRERLQLCHVEDTMRTGHK